MKKLILLCAVINCAMFGCGGAGGSTTSTLQTVYLTSSPTTDRLEVDVVTGNSCTTGGGSIVSESVGISVTSTAYPNTVTPSPITIQSISITYQGYNTAGIAHPIPIHYDTGGTVVPGTTVFNVKVAPESLKVDLLENMGFTRCSLDIWEYYAVITFSGVENFSNKSFSFSEKVKVSFADRNNI